MFLFRLNFVKVNVGEREIDELKCCNEVFVLCKNWTFALVCEFLWQKLIKMRLHNEVANYLHCIIEDFVVQHVYLFLLTRVINSQSLKMYD